MPLSLIRISLNSGTVDGDRNIFHYGFQGLCIAAEITRDMNRCCIGTLTANFDQN